MSGAGPGEWPPTEGAEDAGVRLRRVLRMGTPPRPARGAPIIVGLTGSVCVGKSTLAELFGAALRATGWEVASMTGDAFLWPNARLDAAGLSMRKGFPETYDPQTLREALATLRRGDTVRVPIYRHDVYDVVAGEWESIRPGDVVLVDGLHLGRFARSEIDRLVYLEAAEDVLERWYVERFEGLVREAARREAAGEGPSFYSGFVPMDPDDRRGLATALWQSINLVNLRDHISGDRERADVVITFDDAHGIRSVEVRTDVSRA
jgi:type I pantothenate kinase